MSDQQPRRAGARARIAALVGAGLIAVAALAYVADRGASAPAAPAESPRATTDRPVLLLLTSLPLVFGEKFGLEGGGSAALKALETRWRVVPIDTADAASLARGRVLLMAQPLAQPAETLVELDRWVRRGGQVLLLADPALDWHSERPLGDPFRPPTAFADTGLLKHWGLRLDAPDELGPRQQQLAGLEVLTASPGLLAAQAGGRCTVATSGLVAHCLIGRGEATVVADADFLDVDTLDGPTQSNLKALLAELAALAQ